jgi:hypothetical protein
LPSHYFTKKSLSYVCATKSPFHPALAKGERGGFGRFCTGHFAIR